MCCRKLTQMGPPLLCSILCPWAMKFQRTVNMLLWKVIHDGWWRCLISFMQKGDFITKTCGGLCIIKIEVLWSLKLIGARMRIPFFLYIIEDRLWQSNTHLRFWKFESRNLSLLVGIWTHLFLSRRTKFVALGPKDCALPLMPIWIITCWDGLFFVIASPNHLLAEEKD